MRRVAGVLLVLYSIGLAVIAVWPTPVDRPVYGLLIGIIGRLQDSGLGFVTYGRVESASNALLFVPVGLLLAGLFGRGWRWLALSVCIAVTLMIEFTQQVLLPFRHADLRDIVANSIGSAVGIAIILVLERLHRRRSNLKA